jgi:hypothetical protein
MTAPALRRAGLAGAAALLLLAGVADAGEAFPQRFYPRALPAHGGALSLCPNPSGLEAFDASALAAARRTASRYGSATRHEGQLLSDRAWWPGVARAWRHGSPGSEDVLEVRALRSSPALGSIIAYSCGKALVRLTEWAALKPPGSGTCIACISQLFLVDRRGRVLAYYLY